LRVVGFSLLFVATAAAAATRIEELTVRPDPGARQVEIAITINRGQFDKQSCEVLLSPGDDSSTRLTFSIGDATTRTVRYTYKKDGAYTVRASAASGCTGSRTASVLVGSQPQPAAAPVTTPQAPAQAGCPAGWYVVPESVQGAKFSCRPNLPSQALRCEGGTSYFAEGGAIGCR
jgi:hypothetical protein